MGKSIKGRAISTFNAKLENSFMVILIKYELLGDRSFGKPQDSGDSAVVLNKDQISDNKKHFIAGLTFR